MDTRDILNVELLATGTFFGIGSAPEGDTYTEADLDGIAEAAAKLSLKCPVKLGHTPDQKLAQADGLPAVGWVENLRRVGDKLLGDLKNVAGKVADLIEAGAYRARSSELLWNYADADGTVYPRVFTGLALLGADIPAVTNLDDIVALYAGQAGELHAYTIKEPAPEPKALAVVLPLSEEGSYEWRARQIAEALPVSPGVWWWVRLTYPEFAVVDRSAEAEPREQTWIVPYSMEAGTVTLADQALWQRVESEQVFVSVGYAREAERRLLGLLERHQARAQPASPQPRNQPGKEGMMKEAIYKALGLAPETTEDDALAQVRELAERRNYISRDSEEFKALESKAAEADQYQRTLYERDRKALLDRYEGSKFLPPERAHWEKLYDADPQTTKTLLESAKPVIELGPSGSGGGGGEPRDLSNREELHRAAKEYQTAHPEATYREALKAVSA